MRTALARLFVLLLALLLLAAIVVAAWLGYAAMKRSQRERMTIEALAPPTGRWVDVGDSRLFVQEWGPPNGPLLLLSHGTGGWSGTWFDLPTTLAAAGWRVIAVDLPPFGLSASNGRVGELDYSRPAQAYRLLNLIAQLGNAGEVTLVGHSMGAGPALEAAMRSPTSLRRLVLVAPALRLGPSGEAPSCTPLPAWVPLLLGRRDVRSVLIAGTASYPAFTHDLLDRFVHRKEAITPERIAAYQLPMRRFSYSADIGDWAYAFAGAGCEASASLDPQRIRAWAQTGPPVVLIWGTNDSVTPIAQARSLQRWMPEAQLVEIPDVGHIPHVENPSAFATALLAAAGRVETPPRSPGGPARAVQRRERRP